VRLVRPVRIGTDKYRTLLWLKDYLWASGFQIYCEFVVEDNKAKVTRIMNETMTDVVEDEEINSK
jgi:molybdopterin-biosynthesis enzyme MoeA-like protein